MDIPVRRLVPYSRVVKKPHIPHYAAVPCTLGEHIRKKRIESRLSQKQVCKTLHVSKDCVTGWENGRNNPQIHHYPVIIAFLGYYPFVHETDTLAGKLMYIRFSYGLSFKECAAMLCISEDAAMRWERGKSINNAATQELIIKVWDALPKLQLQHPI